MNNKLLSVMVLLTVCLVACRRAEVADLVLHHGVIVTVDKKNPRAQAVAVTGNTITAVGSDADIGRHIKPGHTRVIDLEGKMVVPGFNDAHIHFFGSGARLVDLNFTGVTSFERMSAMVAERVARSEPGQWIIGRGWDHTQMPGQLWPNRDILDHVAPVNPVLLHRIDGHSVLVNSVVLKEFGITRDTPDPDGGTVVRDRLTGEPTGILKEKAVGLVKRPVYGPEENARIRKRNLLLALEEARECGVTSITQLTGGEEIFEELQRAGQLTLRVNLCQALTVEPDKIKYYHELKERLKVNPLIRFGPLKAFMDGTLGSQTAALFEPFADNPSTSGLLMMPVEKMEELILGADREKFQVCIHAIGTRANNIIL
ncbi:MAG: amidohydrolase, partial [Gemmatimonadota bacterium]|nr:amidohydrolase [Gemmatimonadota bacterium]